MDSHNPAKRKRPASARQRRKATSNSARTRHTQQLSGGSVSTDERDNGGQAQKEVIGALVSGVGTLRDRLQSGATDTMNVVNERVRRVSQHIQKGDVPLVRPKTWIIQPTLSERLHNWISDAMPFTWRERARRRGFWRRRALPIITLVACLGLAIGVGLFALNTAGHAAGAFSVGPSTAQATAGGSVMISPLNNTSTTPTPAAEQYDVGVWVSNTLPQGGSVTVYVRVSNNTGPQPHVRVYIHASTPRGGINIGPLTTDAYGLASAQLNYGNVGSQKPIFLSASTTIGGKTITGTYTFVTF